MTSHKHGVDGVDFCYTTPGELEQARKDAAAIAAVRRLHRPAEWIYGRRSCVTCVDQDGEDELWPCPTAAALGGDPE
jgi:hypothetical protein